MKVNFSTLFNKAHNALTSGRYQVYSPAKNGFPYVETGFFVARGNQNFPLFKIGSSLIDVEKQRNIYVRRFNPAQPKRNRWTHVLVLTNTNCPYKPGRETDVYYFSHHDYLPELFHSHNNLREHRFHGYGGPEQDLSKDGFYIRSKEIYDKGVDLAVWHRDTLKYIRDAIEKFVMSISK